MTSSEASDVFRHDGSMYWGPWLSERFYSFWVGRSATLQVSSEALVLTTHNLAGENARFELLTREVVVRRKRHLFFFKKLVFEHTRAEYPPTIEFYCGSQGRVLVELHRLGYATQDD